MKALILAAGYGTRLKGLGEKTPKALLPVQGIPILDHILKRCTAIDGLNEFIVVTNNKFGDAFEAWASQHQDQETPIRVINDGTNAPQERLGSIGDIDYVLRQYPIEEDLLVVGGDNLFNFDLTAFSQGAQQVGAAITMGVYDIQNLQEATRFGVVETDAKNKVIGFQEKPADPQSSLIAMCFYYLPKVLLTTTAAYLEQTTHSDTAGDYVRWVRQYHDVYGFKFLGQWYDIGSLESYQEAQQNFTS